MIYPQQTVIDFKNPELEELNSKIDIDITHSGPLHAFLNDHIQITAKGKPVVKPSSCEIPKNLLAYRKITDLSIAKSMGVCPHHFVSDEYLESLWTKLASHANKIRKIGWTLSPDFSMQGYMTPDQRAFNDFRNKYLSAIYQLFGIDVIAAPAWGDLKHMDLYMDGWPHNCLIAINSTGVCYDKRARYIWLDGYYQMINILHPSHILRYGGYVEGENRDISTYYNNDNRKGIYYGF